MNIFSIVDDIYHLHFIVSRKKWWNSSKTERKFDSDTPNWEKFRQIGIGKTKFYREQLQICPWFSPNVIQSTVTVDPCAYKNQKRLEGFEKYK